ncbi:MAG: grasp-with-spasm system ATP-grasp peptide maturase [bacterium]
MIETISNDFTTLKVIEWMDYYNIKYYCITVEDTLDITLNQYNELMVIKIRDQKFSLNEITGYWFRRGLFEVRMKQTSPFYNKDDEFAIPAYNLSVNEKNVALQYLHHLLGEKKSVNSFLYSNVNKLIALHEAKKLGLTVPMQLLTNSKKELLEFYNTCKGNVISKVCSPSGGFETANFNIGVYTEFLDEELISNMKNNFSPSFFQENINKQFEVRSFFLHGKFFSMAIFSQESEKTKIDFRNYDEEFPNRNVSFILPNAIEEQLRKLFNTLNLNSGSADLIYSTEGKYYFLEINPVGQFGMVSYPCNYFLEREIALFFKTKN